MDETLLGDGTLDDEVLGDSSQSEAKDSDDSYGVGSMNFSRRKIGHAHDNSAASENVAGAREPSVHAHFIFRFENGQGNQRFVLPMTKIQLKQVNHKLSQRTVDAPLTGRFREESSGPERSLLQHGLVEKKKNKLCG